MAMLGDILAASRHSAGSVERWLAAEDPRLHAALLAAAHRAGLGPAAFLRATVASYAREAGEEDWATLASRLRRAEDPGAACLLAMLEWRLGAAGAELSPEEAVDAR
jgi:hypothetical protein